MVTTISQEQVFIGGSANIGDYLIDADAVVRKDVPDNYSRQSSCRSDKGESK